MSVQEYWTRAWQEVLKPLTAATVYVVAGTATFFGAFVGLAEAVRSSEKGAASMICTLPFDGWKPDSYQFGQDCSYPTEGAELKVWGLHLGEDCNVPAGTEVRAISNGKVMYEKVHSGESKDKRNWGGVVIIAHTLPNGNFVYSLSGHMRIAEGISQGTAVRRGQVIGTVAEALTPENGWWEDAHLHLQVIVDQMDVYRGGALRGYVHEKAPNRLADCAAPSAFFELFGKGREGREL